MKSLAVRIKMNTGGQVKHWDGALFRTRLENLGVAWRRMTCDIPPEYLPESKEDFLARDGAILFFRSY